MYVNPLYRFSLYAREGVLVPGYFFSASTYLSAYLPLEGQAVSTLIDSWIGLVGAYGDGVQRAQILCLFMVLALVNGAADRLIT